LKSPTQYHKIPDISLQAEKAGHWVERGQSSGREEGKAKRGRKMSQVSNLDVPLDELVQAQDMRGRGGGRMRGGKRYSPRRDESSPYARRGGRMGSRPFRGGGGGGGFSTNGAAPVSAGPSNRVYVGNLPWQTSWQDLKDHMRQAGNVVRADVFVDETGRSKVNNPQPTTVSRS